VPLSVMNSLLGGKFISRINLNLREKHGYTYGAHSSFANRLGPGPFQVSAAVATDRSAPPSPRPSASSRRLQEEPPAAVELADAVQYLEGVFPYTLQTVESVAQRLSQLAVFGLADDYFDRYFVELREVTAEVVRDVAGASPASRQQRRRSRWARRRAGAAARRFGPVAVWSPAARRWRAA
jgi:zinc protease